MPKTKADLIAELDYAHDEMHRLLKDIDAQQEIYPTWTAKELISHMTGWDDGCIASLRAHVTGDVPSTPAARGINPYNASTVHEREALSLDHVVREWELTRETFKQLIQELPDEKLNQPFVFPWGEKGTLEGMVQIFAEHEREHVAEIRQLKGLQSIEPSGSLADSLHE